MTNQEELGRRAVACRHWEWLPGMLARFGAGERQRVRELTLLTAPGASWPDLSDPATLGCLLHLVEEALGFPVCVYVPRLARRFGSTGWLIESAHDNGQSYATDNIEPSRAQALVAALEAAP